MAYKNPNELLVDAAKFPALIEAKLPTGAPKISTSLLDAANRLPVLPDFPMEVPNLPAPPELPALPELPAGPEGLRRYVSGVEVRPAAPAAVSKREIIPSPHIGTLPEVTTRRGL